jgi:hypothetical protein
MYYVKIINHANLKIKYSTPRIITAVSSFLVFGGNLKPFHLYTFILSPNYRL